MSDFTDTFTAVAAVTTLSMGFLSGLATTYFRRKELTDRFKLEDQIHDDVQVPNVLMELVSTLREELDRVQTAREKERAQFEERVQTLEKTIQSLLNRVQNLEHENRELKSKLYDHGQ